MEQKSLSVKLHNERRINGSTFIISFLLKGSQNYGNLRIISYSNDQTDDRTLTYDFNETLFRWCRTRRGVRLLSTRSHCVQIPQCTCPANWVPANMHASRTNTRVCNQTSHDPTFRQTIISHVITAIVNANFTKLEWKCVVKIVRVFYFLKIRPEEPLTFRF